MVAEEKTSWLAPFGKKYVVVTVFLLVVMVLGYGGIVYGGASQSFLFLSYSRRYSAGFVFALTAWSGVVSTAVYLINAFFGERFERRVDAARSAPSCSPAAGAASTRCTTPRPWSPCT